MRASGSSLTGLAQLGQLRRQFRPRLACSRCQTRSNSSTARPPASLSRQQKPYYVTTPIFYVNASPHLGHLHSLVLTDVLARFRRLREPERQVLFATGTDEHGLKIQKAAEAGGMSEQQFCDDVSQRFKNLCAQANISHTTFIRTSEDRHLRAVEHFWKRLVQSGDIYKATHSGWYSVSDETFYGTSQVEKRDSRMVSVETGNEVVWTEEENWKFRLSKYRDQVRAWASNPSSVQPETYRNAVLQEVEVMDDLSVSRPRSRVRWGVPVPNDPEQTIYVWVDALINYITVLGFPQQLDGWPADAHIVGKDIVKFHAVHWPALLMSAKLVPPRTVLTHAHWTMSRAKMSKSKGNVVDPIASMQKWGVDGVRWYLMRVGGSLPLDSDYSEEALASHYRQLGDMVGNLLSRSRSPKICNRMKSAALPEHDEELDQLMSGLRDTVTEHMENYRITKACEAVMDLMAAANKQFARLAPWKADDSTTAITYAHHCLRLAGIMMQPVMPGKAAELLDTLGVPQHERTWEGAVWPPLGCAADAIPAPRQQAAEKHGAAGKNAAGPTLFPPVEVATQ